MSDPTNENAVATATAAPASPRQAWYHRRWAVIAGAVAAAAILFFGGMTIGTTIGDQGRDGFGHDGRSFPGDGDGSGRQDWGDNSQGGQGMVPPGMGQGQGMGQDGQGFGHDGDGFGHDGDGFGQPQAPGATPAPVPLQSTSPQALTQ